MVASGRHDHNASRLHVHWAGRHKQLARPHPTTSNTSAMSRHYAQPATPREPMEKGHFSHARTISISGGECSKAQRQSTKSSKPQRKRLGQVRVRVINPHFSTLAHGNARKSLQTQRKERRSPRAKGPANFNSDDGAGAGGLIVQCKLHETMSSHTVLQCVRFAVMW